MAAETQVARPARVQTSAGVGRVLRVTAAEWRWACRAAAILMAVTVIPYALAADGLVHGQVFGVLPLSVEDGFSYLAKMQQGARGAWSFTLPYSSEPHEGVFLFMFYLVLGKLSGSEHLAQLIVFHGVRLIFGFASLLAFYRLAAEFTPAARLRRFALLVYAGAGGLGWLSLGFVPTDSPANGALAVYPLELYSPETFSVISLLGWPHLLAARALVIVALIALFRDRPWQAGAALAGTALLVPLSVIPVWGIALVIQIFRWVARAPDSPGPLTPATNRALGPAGLRALAAWPVFVLPAPFVLYGAVVLQAHPVLAQFFAQNQLPSPAFIYYALAYGVWWLLAAAGISATARYRPEVARVTAVWLVLGLLLVYIPISTQRRLIEGYWPLLVALAVAGLPAVALKVGQWNRVVRSWLVPGLAAWTLPGTVLVVASAFVAVLAPAAPTYVPLPQTQVFSRVADTPGVALGDWMTLTWAPAFTALTGYAGHSVETLEPDQKRADIAWFYSATPSAAERVAFLRQHGIVIVFHGPLERGLGDFDPASVDVLEPIGEPLDGYAVYRVVRTDGTTGRKTVLAGDPHGTDSR